MRLALLPSLVVALLGGAVLGCPTPSAPEAPDAPEATAAPAPWYRQSRPLDLTGDGRPDRVRLDAHGPRPDSLQIDLVLVVGGEETHRETWESGYELALADSVQRAPARRDAFLRARLDSVLARVEVERLDSPAVLLMPEDRAILDRLDPRPTHRITLSYGYETTVRLVWDAPNERFVPLWSCC